VDLEEFDLDFEEIELLSLQLAITNLSLASIHGAEGRLDKAINEYSRALEFDPGLYAGYVSRGRLFLRKGEPRKALEDMSRAINLEPGVASTYLLRGDIHLEQGDSAAARRDYQTALQLAPTHPEVTRRMELIKRLNEARKPPARRKKSGT
jgi:tetratricopeptide (TPR) repeat protein